MSVTFANPQRQRPQIEMTPLIDVVFQLLVFFMITSVFAPPAVELTLPRLDAKAEPAQMTLVLHLDGDGRLFLDDRPVPENELGEALRAALGDSDDRAVYFRGDKDARYDRVLHLMQVATEAGAARFNFIYDPEQ